MRRRQFFHDGDRVRVRVSGWEGTVVKTRNVRGELLQSGGHQDVIVLWDNGHRCRMTLAKKNLELLERRR